MADVLRAIFESDDHSSDFEGFSDFDSEVEDDASVDPDQSGDDDDGNVPNDDDGCTNRLSGVVFDEFTERPGPNLPEDFNPDMAGPLEFFLLLFPTGLIESLVTHTNNYARWRAQQTDQEDDKWTETTAQEIRAFLGINILMGIQQLPVADLFWSSNPFVGNPGVQNVMTCNRFHKLAQYFHVSSKEEEPRRGSPNYDKLFKVRPVLEALSWTFQKFYTLSREVAVDEAMVKYTGRLSFKQYLPAKPIKRGMKVWMLCDSNTAYLSRFEIYLGRQNNQTEHGLGYNVVTRLTNHLENTFRHIYFDSFFTGVPLMNRLLDIGLYACGTVRSNRKEFSKKLKKPRDVQNRGDFKILQKKDSNLTACVWKDKRLVHHLSTLSDPTVPMQAQRRIGPNVINVQQPQCVHSYNRFTGGVDLHDQYRMKYDVGRNSKKWWRYLFWFLLNCAIVNAFILYKMSSRRQTKKKRYTHLDFRTELLMELIGGYSKRKRTSNEHNNGCFAEAENIQGHIHGKLPGPKRRCRYHLTQLKERKETLNGCTVCRVHLCRDGCHGRYHNM